MSHKSKHNPTPKPTHTASASIVIPIRLQVTADKLTTIEELKDHITRQILMTYGRTTEVKVRLQNKHKCTIHEVSVDPS